MMTALTEFSPDYFFDVTAFEHAAIFENVTCVWDVLRKIKDYCEGFTYTDLPAAVPAGVFIKGTKIAIGEGTIIEEGAYISEPTIIGRNCVIRHGAYVRGNIITGDNVIIGHATEVKNSIFLDHAKAPHFNYVGDSILGAHINLGAGTKLSNVKILDDFIKVNLNGTIYETGLRKFGAIIGDRSQAGCNSVLNPGCLLGPDSLVYPNVTATGWYASGSIVKPSAPPRVLKRR